MAFGTNYDNIPQGGGIVPEGDYECIITNAEIRQTQNGKLKVGFTLTIRNDIRQDCQNRVLFVDIWRKREPTPADEQVDGFNYAQLMAVARAAQIPSGQSFDSLEQFLQALCGRCLLATVKHETYNGSTSAKVDPLSTAPTRLPECRHVQKQKPQTPAYGSAPQNNGYSRQGSYPQGNGYNQQGSSYRQNTGYQQSGSYPPPAQPPAYPPAYPPAGSFEEILSDGQVPF